MPTVTAQPVGRRPRSSRPRDLAATIALFIIGAFVGSTYVRAVSRAEGAPKFYQDQFGAAVMMACGRGYVDPDDTKVPTLRAFLHVERDQFSCDQISEHVETLPLTPMQRAFRYLMSTVAWTWRWRGLSWSSLAPLYGAFFGATIVASYALFRTGMGPALALLASGALTVSTIHLIYLPHLRDYSKAPFVLTLVVLLAWLVKGPLRPMRTIFLSALYGLVLGIGVGFRNDLLIALPPLVLVVAVFLPTGVRERVVLKIGAIAACLLALYFAMFPMRAIYAPGGGNSMQHVIALGLVAPFNDALGVSNGGLYEWGYDFQDEYAHAVISSYATRVWGAERSLQLYGSEYDRAATAYLGSVATNFPADMLVRVYAAALKVLAIPYNETSLQPPTWLSNRWLLQVYRVRERVLRALGAVWPWIVGAALIGLSLADPRKALFVLFLVVYFAAYPVLQFHERHFFHLEFMAWWALGFVVQQTIEGVGAWREPGVRTFSPRRWLGSGPRIRAAAMIWALVAVIVVAPLWMLRRYQERHVAAMLTRYLALERVPLDRTAASIGAGLVRIDSPARAETEAPGGPPGSVRSEYLVAEFGSEACEWLKLDVAFRYRSDDEIEDFSRTMQIRPPPANGSVERVFFPAYFHRAEAGGIGEYGLAGIDLPAVSSNCLSALYRIRDVQGLPLLLDLHLPNGWERATLYYTIDGLESRNNGIVQPDIYTWPPDLPVGRNLAARPLAPLAESDIAQRASTLQVRGAEWIVDGVGGVGGRGPFLYLAQMKERAVRQGSLVLAEGRLDHGGLSVGLVKNGAWTAQVPVTAAGEFLVVIRVPEDGNYSLIVANNVPGRSLENKFTIRRIGWLPLT